MPKGNPNAQTKATARYEKKAGYARCTFKVKENLYSQFKEACNIAGSSQSGTIALLMQQFVDGVIKKEKEDTKLS